MRSLHICTGFIRALTTAALVATALHVPVRTAAQEATTADARLNFSIPDIPAFKIVDDDPSTIMKPSNLREVTVAVSNFLLGGRVLPGSFAAEFAPMMLIEGDSLSLKEYDSTSFLNSIRVSLATQRLSATTGSTQASFGLRFTLYDDSDPRSDTEYIRRLSDIALNINRVAAADPSMSLPPTESVSRYSNVNDIATLEAALEDARSDYKDTAWNNNIVEFALAVSGTSADSLLEDIIGTGVGGWLVGGFGIGRSAQLQVGANALLGRDTLGKMKELNLSLSARLYAGWNELKFFAQGQYTSRTTFPSSSFLTLGGEVNLGQSFWLEFGVGYNSEAEGKSNFVPKFNLQWGLPETAPTEN